MNKLPILATIRAAYGFTFGHLGAIIGAIWLPMVIVSVAGFFAMQRYYDATIDVLESGATATLGPVLLLMLGYFLVALFLQSVMFAGVTQIALERRQGGPMQFSLGPGEWRLFRAMISLLGLLILLALTSGLLAQGAGLVLRGAPAAQILAAQGVVQLVLMAAFVFLALRFLFLLPAVAVAEDGPALARAWTLSKGNFWRMFAVYAALFAPVMALVAGMEISLLRPAEFLGASGAVSEVAMYRQMRAALPMLQGIAFFLSPFLTGLPVGAAVAGWRVLAPAGRA